MINYIYTLIVGVAFSISLFSFRLRYEFHLKLFSLLLGATFIVEVSTLFMMKKHVNTARVYNLFMPVEYACYAYYYLLILKTSWIKKLIVVFMIIYPLTGILTTFTVFKFNNWNSYEAIVGNFFTIVFAVSYYIELFVSDENARLKRNPEFWIALGMIIFYSCFLPFVGTMNYLDAASPKLAGLFSDLIDYIDILMYLIFSYAFLCRIIIKK